MSVEQDITRYEDFLRQDPGNYSLLMALGDLYLQAGRADAALQCFDRCVAADPGQVVAHGRRAEVLLSQRHYPEAEHALRGLLADAPDEPALLHNLGLAVYFQERWQEAADLFAQARNLGLGLPRNILFLAYSLHRLGRLDDAIAACKQALASTPDAGLDGYLAILELDAGHLQIAHAHAESVLRRTPDNADAALVCGMWHIERQEIERAQPHIETALRGKPGSARGWLAQGLIHLYMQDFDKAIAALETAQEGMPDHLGTHVTLGWARFAARDIAGAERTFKDVIAKDGAFAEAHGGLAVCLMAQNRVEEARREAQIARRLNPGNLEAIWVKGAFMADQGRPEAGTALLNAALQRPISADGRSLSDHIRQYARRQVRKGTSRPGSE